MTRALHRSSFSEGRDLPGTLPSLVAPALGLLVATLALAPPAQAQYTALERRMALGVDDVEITPNGRYAVGRTTAADTVTFVIDLETGVEVLTLMEGFFPPCFSCTGPSNDAVALNDERAVTLGFRVRVIDLTTTPPTQIAEHEMGERARDVALSPDGRFAIVRGDLGSPGGTYVLDLTTGAILLNHFSEPPPVFLLGHDLAEATDGHGVSLAYDQVTDRTDVLVVEFDPPGGGGPRIVLDATGPASLEGRPMDVAVSPDGLHAAVRAEDEIGLIRLDGTNTGFVQNYTNFPAQTVPFLDSAFDSIVMTDDLWASISVALPSVSGGYLDIQNLNGDRWFALINGTPRDLVLTPDGETLLVHTGRRIYEFDMANLPAGGGALPTFNSRVFPATTSGLLAGLDSVVCTNEIAAVIAPFAGETELRLYDLSQGPIPNRIYSDRIPGSTLDVDISRDGNYVVASTLTNYIVVDTRTLTTRLEGSAQVSGFYPWCDGVAVHPDHAAAFAVSEQNLPDGWVDLIDLVSRETLSCRSFPNSTGEIGELFALGSTRVPANDLELFASSLPSGSVGLFVLGDMSQMVPLGGGLLCVGGNLIRFGVQATTADGTATEAVDYLSIPPIGGGIVPGSTWYAQFVHRDLPGAGGFNFTNASALLFE
ncbi:MAG: hypothetical protein AAF957_28675 [Planctomycetota bacterium]